MTKKMPQLLSVRTNLVLWTQMQQFWKHNPEFNGKLSATLSLAISKLASSDSMLSFSVDTKQDDDVGSIEDADW